MISAVFTVMPGENRHAEFLKSWIPGRATPDWIRGCPE